MRLLILGGTSEASLLAAALAQMPQIDATLSLAGRTQAPARAPLPSRTGGFGGAAGLAAYLRGQRFEAVVDATHPFAAQISLNAVAACAEAGVPLVQFSRPAWVAQAGDNWVHVADLAGAVAALGVAPRRVFLTVGRLGLPAFAVAPQHYYLVRSIDPIELAQLPPQHRLLRARGPFALADEIALMQQERIDCLVTKNSGGTATQEKLAAARALGLVVVMVERPASSGAACLNALADVLDWIAHHRAAP